MAARMTLERSRDVIEKAERAVRAYGQVQRLREMEEAAYRTYLKLVRQAVAAGATHREIADQLGITETAVYLHLKETR